MSIAKEAPHSALELALAYAARGWAVFPIKPRDKRPLTEHGFKDATKDPAVVTAWWREHPAAGIGIATGEVSGLAVLDIDPRNGGDETLSRILAQHGALPETPRVLTGGGGTHYYFRHRAGLGSGKLAEGIDLKADGGYVVAPPSVHPSGAPYRWDVGALPTETPTSEPAAWVAEGPQRRAAGPELVPLGGSSARETLLGEAFFVAGWLGGPLPGGKCCVRCPWVHEHSDGRGDGRDSSTIIMPPTTADRFGAFVCSHSHCAGRGWAEVMAALPAPARDAGRAKFRPVAPVPSLEPELAAHLEADADGVLPDEPDAGGDTRPIVQIAADEHHRELAEACAALADPTTGDPLLFERSHDLVTVVGAGRSAAGAGRAPLAMGTPIIRPLVAASLQPRLTKHVRFRRWVEPTERKSGGWVACAPAPRVAAGLLALGDWPGVRTLVGITETPVLRPDGSLLQAPGYDSASGYLFVPACTYPTVPEAPSQDDARAALRTLRGVFVDFPYVDPAHAMVPIAAILTVLARPAIAGSVPLFLFDASTRGSGKTLQADVVSIIALGRHAARQTFPANDEELEKVLGAYAIAGTRLILLDNITRPLGGGPLDKVLTATGSVALRLLGASEIRELPWSAVLLASGNNVAMSEDTQRRMLSARLESTLETPEDREGFEHDDLPAWTMAERPRLVTAALTILRAYTAKGSPPAGCARWGSFEAWARLIPHALLFAGGADPMLARPRGDAARTDAQAALATLLTDLPRLSAGAPMRARAILDALYPAPKAHEAPDGWDDLREALELLAPPRGGPAPTARALGDALRRAAGRVLAGRRLTKAPAHAGTVAWSVEKVGGEGQS